ncbi:MAG: glycosyltransferase, partial [Actinobacteria bacterium]|nr:glycosyltransferase [Actinomycetota bacterium]
KDFLDNLPKLREKRQKIQKARRRDDKAIFSYFKGQFLAVSPDKDYQEKQIEILKSLGIYELFEKKIKRTLLIVSGEVVSKEMAGPAIRVWNFAKVLSQYMNVILAIPNEPNLPEQEFKIVQYRTDNELREIIKNVDIILSGGTTFLKYPSIKNSEKFLIMDIYDPYNLASLVEYKDEPFEKRLDVHKLIHYNLNEQLYWGDFFICASERQRDFWLGMLAALGRVNPFSHDEDPTLRKMIDVVPFGLPSNMPLHTENVLKGVIKGASNKSGIYKNDFVVIWGGGIYNWFDPLTLIRAMAEISRVASDVKLFFMGVKHPNPQVKELKMVDESVSLSKKLGVYEKNVFFNFGWVEYDKRQNYLLESDAGIITHPLHVETRFSYRTRVLDYIWAGLPIISTRGDSLSDLIEKEGLGITVREGNVVDIVEAILKLKEDRKFYEECVKNIERIREEFTWEKVCEPLIKFCKDPVVSAYKKKLEKEGEAEGKVEGYKLNRRGLAEQGSALSAKRGGAVYLVRRFLYHLIHSGPKKTLGYLSNYILKRR